MIKQIVLLSLALGLTGCVTASTTSQSWSCRAIGNQTCASISEIDSRPAVQGQAPKAQTIFGARPANWWDAPKSLSVTREDAPRREFDQTMRIVVAPFVDAQGDYHDRSDVYAVMRKAQWWIAPPVAISASPEPGSTLPVAQPAPSQTDKK